MPIKSKDIKMALKSIKVTTSQIADAITANKIGAETSVTITDNLYTATDLLSIIAETNKTIRPTKNTVQSWVD